MSLNGGDRGREGAGERKENEMDLKSKKGFALPVAVFALVVVGVLVTGGFYLARQETRIGLATKRGTEAFYLAEQGAMEVISEWNAGTFGALPNWGSAAVTDTTDGGTWTVDITRMTSRLFFLHSTGTVSAGQAVLGEASRSVGYVARLASADLAPRAALTTRGKTDVRGTAEVHGGDTYPPGWAAYCDNPPQDLPGILTNDVDDVTTRGQGEVTGDPPVVGDPDLSDEDFRQFGDLSWEDLVAMADIRLGSGGTITINNTGPDVSEAGVCRTGQSYPLNWGDPLDPAGPCGDWFPIIYIDGSAMIQSGGVGQGILLVENNLDLRGDFTFNGLVIVQGNFETQGSGNRVNGGVMASNADFDDQLLVGGSVVQNSQCAVIRAVLNNSALTRVRPLERRSWVDLSSLMGG